MVTVAAVAAAVPMTMIKTLKELLMAVAVAAVLVFLLDKVVLQVSREMKVAMVVIDHYLVVVPVAAVVIMEVKQ